MKTRLLLIITAASLLFSACSNKDDKISAKGDIMDDSGVVESTDETESIVTPDSSEENDIVDTDNAESDGYLDAKAYMEVAKGYDEFDSWICLNDYVDFEVLGVDSKHIEYMITQTGKYDRIAEYDYLETGVALIIESEYDGEWDNINRHLPYPDGVYSSAAIALAITEKGYRGEYYWRQESIPAGHYRAIKKVRPTIRDEVEKFLSDDTFYVSIEFDVPEG